VFLHISLTFHVFFLVLFLSVYFATVRIFFWNVFGMHISAMLKFFGLKL